MTNRVKQGIGNIISGAVFIAVGIIMIALVSTPVWVPVAISVIGSIVSVLGLRVAFPDNE